MGTTRCSFSRTNGKPVIPLAVETDLQNWLSGDENEGRLSMPLRLVGSGSSSTTIKRGLFLPVTGGGLDEGTDAELEVEITAGGVPVVRQPISETPQADLESPSGNWYPLDVDTPFTRGDVLSNGGIRLNIRGQKATDAWLPKSVFIYGFDTVEGRPTEIVPLVSIPHWNTGWLSTDPGEGEPSVRLPVI